MAQAAESAVQTTRYGQVIASSLYIRTGAGTEFDKAGSLKNGAIVTITGQSNGWYKISSGYVSSDYVSIVDEATAKAAQAAAANTTNGQKMAEFALKYVGYPYVYGGSSPKGFDCSGFVKYVCNQFGYNVNRTASAQMDNGTSVSRDQLQPGDLPRGIRLKILLDFKQQIQQCAQLRQLSGPGGSDRHFLRHKLTSGTGPSGTGWQASPHCCTDSPLPDCPPRHTAPRPDR